MKIQFHWGTGIALVFALFVFSLVFAVIKSTTIDNALVRDDYYKEDVHYQEKKDKIARTRQLGEAVGIKYLKEQGLLMLYFPRNMEPSGEIYLYRPSDASMDRRFLIEVDSSGIQLLPVHSLQAGYWTVKVDWTAHGQAYYMEEEIRF